MTETVVAPGTLYLVGTPIGNLKDWSVRAQEILGAVDGILAEDTRVTGLLCYNAGIRTPFLSFHAHNTKRRIPEVIERLQSGQALALVSDRGMPSISDPGQELVQALWSTSLSVSVIPGPSALDTAFVASGFPTPLGFWGFISRDNREKRRTLSELVAWPHTAIIYESPHHLSSTIEALVEALGTDQEVFFGREMTKQFEEFWRGTLGELQMIKKDWRGECVLVLGPKKKEPESVDANWPQLCSQVEFLVHEGLHPNEAIRRVSREYGIARRELYDRIHNVRD